MSTPLESTDHDSPLARSGPSGSSESSEPSGDAPSDGARFQGELTGNPPFDPPMDPAVTTIQPGGGIVMSIELAWGYVRRWLLRRLRPGFVRRMAQSRQGSRGPLPFEPVDPRDVKYYRNQDTYWWAEADDPFAWRDALPFVRVGLAELVLLGGGFFLLAIVLGWLWWPLAIAPLVVTAIIVWFFRNPTRHIPEEPGTVVSPADGKLVQIERVDDPVLGKCVQFGIFLSIFNVHANRASLPGRVVAIRYRPGKFLNALRPESARENENLDVILASDETMDLWSGERDEVPEGLASETLASKTSAPEASASEALGLIRIRQITGQFARRIVCWVRPGDVLQRGEMYGMIKLGSRTEILIPDDERLEILANLGDKVRAGSTVLGRYRPLMNQSSRST